MEKRILTEINRNREIMGLEVIIEQEKTEKEVTDFKELLKAFKMTSPEERQDFVKVLVDMLKKAGMKKEQIQAMVDELKKHAKAPLEESQRLDEQAPFNWNRWLAMNGPSKLAGGVLNFLSLGGISYVGKGKKRNVMPGGLTIKKAKPGMNKKLNSLGDVTVNTDPANWEEYYDKYNKKFTKRIIRGKNKWLSAWNANEGEMNEFIISVLEQFNELKGRMKRKVKVVVGNKPDETIVPVEPKYESYETVFPIAGQPSADFFEDNEFQVTDKFKSSLQKDLIDELNTLAKKLKPAKGKPAFWLRGLQVGTSCSAINNGTSSDGKKRSFVELAEDRAQAGLDYILEALKTVNPPVLVGDNGGGQESIIITNAKGENEGKTAEDGRDLTGTSGPVLGEQGSPTNKSEYEKYKYFNAVFDIVGNDTTEQKDEPDDEIIYTNKLAVNMKVPSKRAKTWYGSFRLPKFKFGLPLFGWVKKLFSKKNNIGCPAFWE
tara:strand:- start:729 stop:2195 length:1467 start_codon:yes stop_codon:yes gene_type:complete